ncbi:MAG: rhomboid family intramembrane serine protease [Desulfobacterales bacterium]
MLPIRDNISSRSYPVVNQVLIGVNILVFLIQLAHGTEVHRFNITYGLVPARFSNPALSSYFGLWSNLFSLLSFMFLHGGFWHIISNMWSLHIFGDNVEDRMGPIRYLAFYLAAGMLSGLTHLFFNVHSDIPTIGASGAVSGVMGAYFILFPSARILTLIPIIIIPWIVEIPAFFFIGFWFLMQFLNATGPAAASTGVAWWAHVGGFLFGIVLLKVFQRIPESGLSRTLRPATARKKSHRMQVIHPDAPETAPDLHGTLRLTPFEALTGTQKAVTVSRGLHSRRLRVTVPAGVKEGGTLRLKGVGNPLPDGTRGDLLLKIELESW